MLTAQNIQVKNFTYSEIAQYIRKLDSYNEASLESSYLKAKNER